MVNSMLHAILHWMAQPLSLAQALGVACVIGTLATIIDAFFRHGH